MTTLLETERQFLALWAQMEAEQTRLGEDWSDAHIDAWGDRLRPYQQAMERSPCSSTEDVLVIMRQAGRNAEAFGCQLVGEALQNVADWLAPGHGLTCTDPRILRPCPFCGEREHLRVSEGDFERAAVVDGAIVEARWKGNELVGAEYVDAVYCLVCDSMAALDVWNHTRPASDYALLRDFDEPQAQAVAA